MTNSTHPLPEVVCGDAATHLLRGTRADGSAVEIYSSPACDDSIRAYLEFYGYTVTEVAGVDVAGRVCGAHRDTDADLHAEADELRAERDRLADALDEAVAENARLAAEVEWMRVQQEVAFALVDRMLAKLGVDAEGEVAR